jgi:hypothetical protein
MTKYGVNLTAPTNERTSQAEDSGEFQEIKRLIGIAEELVVATEGAFREQSPDNLAPPAIKSKFTAAKAAICARRQFEEVTALKIDSISAVSKIDSGWEVIINAVELLRIPHSTDVLSSFSVHLDDEGNLESYRRSARYTRDQTGEDL